MSSSVPIPLKITGGAIQSALITPDGSAIIAAVGASIGVPSPAFSATITEFSAQTGQPVQTLYRQPASRGIGGAIMDIPLILFSSDPSGRHLLMEGSRFGRLDDNGRFTALSGMSSGGYLVGTGWFSAAW
jgi:hypothetical protein